MDTHTHIYLYLIVMACWIFDTYRWSKSFMVSRDNIIVNLPYGEYRKSDYENGHRILNWTSSTWKYCVYLFEGGEGCTFWTPPWIVILLLWTVLLIGRVNPSTYHVKLDICHEPLHSALVLHLINHPVIGNLINIFELHVWCHFEMYVQVSTV